MGIISSSASITRYKVDGKLEGSVMDVMAERLKKYTITEIDEESSDKSVGWTSFKTPFEPNFEGSSYVIGSLFVFSLRIDKKVIPPKVIQKHFQVAMTRRLKDSGREFLSRNEKKMVKDQVINVLSLRIPSTPNVYDLIWNYEEGVIWFFTNLKSANEELETFFSRTFRLTIIRLFPYTMAELTGELTSAEKDTLSKLNPTLFTE
ncbi:MAG: recombination-associated protein RdgC [Desulfobacteraceae bacterium]|nr:recombination-associated protein RdgC [Desulfobacteraceae bacterium]